jgi:hypothetical protein
MFLHNDPFDAKWTPIEDFAGLWMNGHFLEPMLHRTVQWKRNMRTLMESCGQSPKTRVRELIKDGLNLAADLETTAVGIRYLPDGYEHSSPQQVAFNNMLEVRYENTEAIARCLYRTVRYHIIE